MISARYPRSCVGVSASSCTSVVVPSTCVRRMMECVESLRCLEWDPNGAIPRDGPLGLWPAEVYLEF
jgi:hypothetical protein